MTQPTYKPEDIESKECRFVTYVEPPTPDAPDLHVVKEILHLKDGTRVPHLNFLYDAPRPYWVARKGFRNHKQHKEWERKERLAENSCPQRFLQQRVATALGQPWFRGTMQKLKESPFIYGIDIESTCVIKRAYDIKYPIQPTEWSVAELDIETNMLSDLGEPIMATLSMKTTLYTVVLRSYLEGLFDPEKLVNKVTMKYLGKFITERNIVPELLIVDTEVEMWRAIFNKAHELKPDWLSIWNMEFEMDRFMETCHRSGVDPATITSDPSVPKEYQYFNYKKSAAQKVTSSGKVTPVKPAARWHTVKTPASFYIIDQMCVYKQTRMGEQEEPSYALNAIMHKELGFGKLEIDEAKHIEHATADWHTYMQKNHKIEYLVYNRFDCLGPEMVDEKIKDLAGTLPSMLKTSDISKFPSQPRRTCDDLHWELLDADMVMGVSSSNVADEFDEETLSRDDWIKNVSL